MRFGKVTIAQAGSSGALASAPVAVAFGGSPAVTLAPGQDVLSDPVRVGVRPWTPVAVSLAATGAVPSVTEHFTARQTSFASRPGSGDLTTAASGEPFTNQTTSRPFVTGLEVMAPPTTGTVVAFGDSITDGYSAGPIGAPETAEGVDVAGRYPDVLARRLQEAGRSLGVINAGIGGNLILRDGGETESAFPMGTDFRGPAGLRRFDADALTQAGVTSVVLLEGINDLGTEPQATAAQVTDGLSRLVARAHAAGLRVVLGTLTPALGNNGAHGTPQADAVRQAINTWVRESRTADAVADFDAAVRDPASPSRLLPAFDPGDHLHPNLDGYAAMAAAVPLDALADAPCASPIRVSGVPRRLRRGRTTTLRVRVRAGGAAVKGARVRFGRRSTRTDDAGRARMRVRPTGVGRRRVVVRVGQRTRRVALRVLTR